MTPDAIDITKDFPLTRERIVLRMLPVVRKLREEGIAAVICGGGECVHQ